MVRCPLVLGAATLGVGLATLAFAQDAKSVERGKALVSEQKCRTCHTIAGAGNPKGVLDGIGSKLSAAEIRDWLTNPRDMATKAKADRKPPMISFKNLPPEDLDALVAYVSSLKK